MPVVPIAQNRVGIADVTGAKLVPADYSGTGLQALGGGLADLSKGVGAAEEAAQHRQNLFDEAAVRQADNMLAAKVRERTLTGPNAFYQKTGADAYGEAQATQADLSSAKDAIAASLKNPVQRRMFGEVADRRLNPEFDSVARHADSQLTVYNSDQSKARLGLASDNAVTYADDPARFNEELMRVGSEVAFQTKGQSSDVQRLQLLGAVSGIRTRVVDAKMTSDPVSAAAYYQEHQRDFTAGDRLAVEKALHGPMLERAGQAAADNAVAAVSGAPSVGAAPAPVAGGGSNLARMTAITLHSESRGQDRNADGSILTSSAGAQGRMQVMPDTNTDPGYGVAPARDGSDTERARVGRDYLAAMVKRYGGDPAKAWGAYNGGPGHVDAAIAAHGAGWLAAMKPETQAYVRQNVAMLGGATPGGVGLAPRRDDLNSAYAYIKAQRLGFDVEQAAMSALDKSVARDDHLLNRQQDDAKDQAFKTIDALGVRGFTSVNQLSADVRRNLSPEVYHVLMDQAAQNAVPKPVPADGETALVYNRMAVEDPNGFITSDLRLIRDKVTPGEFGTLWTLQGKMKANPKAPEAVSHEKIWGAISRFAPDLGLDISGVSGGKAKAPEDRAAAMKIFTMMDADLKAATGNKRQPNDDEIDAAFRRAVTTVKVSTPGAGWFGKPHVAEVKRYQLDTPTNDVPGTVRSRIISSFQRTQRRAPTEGEIMQIYGAHHGQQGFW